MERLCDRLQPAVAIARALLAGLLLAALLPVSPARAALGNGSERSGRSEPGNGSGRSERSERATARVYAQDVCPSAPPGHVRCAAEVLRLGSSGALVRPQLTTVVRRGPRRAEHAGRARASITSSSAYGQAPPQLFTPAYLQQAYDLSYLSATNGGTDTVAVIDAYDYPAAAADLARFRAANGLSPCTVANRCLQKVDQDGLSAPLPVGNSDWNVEEATDLDAVSAVCPDCRILLVEADSTAWSDLAAAVGTAARLGATQISNSWMELASSPPAGQFSFPGVSVVASAGDSGYLGPGDDGYPAAFAGVIAAGGTSLHPSSGPPSPRGFTETVWSSTSSGCDTAIAKPSYQDGIACAGRAYADVSADADPSTGLAVYDSGAGGWLLAGGTSLSAPLIAAFEAVTGVDGTSPAWAYADSALLNDPVSGSNGRCAASISEICTGRVGYDGPTGAGSISGALAAGAPGIGGPDISTGAGAGGGTGAVGGAGNSDLDTYVQTVSATAATLLGGVYPNGAYTTAYWQYGSGSAYGHRSAAVSLVAGTAAVSVPATLTGLTPLTTYHYRLVASNDIGSSYGYDYTLRTGVKADRARVVSRVRPGAVARAKGSH
ncbi:MAG: hypothetical protein ACLP8S_25185 [Solirubrobacteraceae bacterium]